MANDPRSISAFGNLLASDRLQETQDRASKVLLVQHMGIMPVIEIPSLPVCMGSYEIPQVSSASRSEFSLEKPITVCFFGSVEGEARRPP